MGGVTQFPPFPVRRLSGATLPTGVLDLDEPPEKLFLTGVMPAGPRVAIVGTRRPTSEAYRFTLELALELAMAGVVVVSGGAVGIDTAAHEGALQAGAGTLVVAPASYDCPYPEQNGDLFRRVVERGGGYLSLFDQPTVARRHVFFARNALMVSLCTSVVLVQAPFRSGARNALLWARRLARPYWVVPHAPWCSQGAAGVAELRLGGKPLASAKEVLAWLAEHHHHPIPIDVRRVAVGCVSSEQTVRRIQATPSRGSTEVDANLGEATQRVVARDAGPHRDVCRLVSQLESGPKHPDELCAVLRWEPARLQATVLHAILMGEVTRTGAGHVAVVPQRR